MSRAHCARSSLLVAQQQILRSLRSLRMTKGLAVDCSQVAGSGLGSLVDAAISIRCVDLEWPRLEASRYQAQSPRGGGTNRRDCRSNAWANASIRASVPGSPTIERFIAGILSAPKPAGMDTSGSPSQLP